MIQTKEEMFLAEMGIHTQTIIEGDYTAKYKLKDLLKKYAEQCNIANVVGQSEQLNFCMHNLDLTGKCFKCGEQYIRKEGN
jgi:hypothetical protein